MVLDLVEDPVSCYIVLRVNNSVYWEVKLPLKISIAIIRQSFNLDKYFI